MRRSISVSVGALLLSLATGAAAEAQLFSNRQGTTGGRTTGSSANRTATGSQNRTATGSQSRTATGSQNRAMAAQTQAGSSARQRAGLGAATSNAAENVGQITGTERFLRESRGAGDFVGRSATDAGGFVGAQSNATGGEIRSAIEGQLVRTAPNPALNRFLNVPQFRAGMYAPRLKLGFSPLALPAPQVGQLASEKLSVSPAIRSAGPIEVSMAGRTATLRGEVASEHDKRLAGLMLLFEPGISAVENQLTVSSAEPPAESNRTPTGP